MNERLKELMLEAGYAVPEIAGRAQVLAQLIVQECIRAVESNRKEPREGYNTYNMGTFEAVDSIKQHFGVEQ